MKPTKFILDKELTDEEYSIYIPKMNQYYIQETIENSRKEIIIYKAKSIVNKGIINRENIDYLESECFKITTFENGRITIDAGINYNSMNFIVNMIYSKRIKEIDKDSVVNIVQENLHKIQYHLQNLDVM